MSNDILKYLSNKIQEEITHISGDLAKGTAKDHGDYKYSCGIVRGLLMVNNMIIETAERMENADD
jgi:hypothetical protein